MNKNYRDITAEISRNAAAIRRDRPDVMRGFHDLSRAAMAEGALSAKTKELIALALGVAAHCDGCIGFHVKALVDQGVTRGELMETLSVAVYMGGGPSLMYAADAVAAFEQFTAAATMAVA